MQHIFSVERQTRSTIRDSKTSQLLRAQIIVSALCLCVGMAISLAFVGFYTAQTFSKFGLVMAMPIEKLAPLSILLIACFVPPIVFCGLQNKFEQVLLTAAAVFFAIGAILFGFTQSYSL
ncbi:MAG: hypothetical protein K2X81_13690 [Candidatus Obscuribacterales bacterium]|nr:hypothetical protein [Candidatus Obscuribacterales bacterium]